MSRQLAIFLPAEGEQPWRWLAIRDGAIAGRGEGLPAPDDDPERSVAAIVPADAVSLHWADLPDRSQAQAVAAAKLLVAEASVSPLADLHVAVGRENGLTERPIGVVANARMTAWLVSLAEAGIEVDRVVPAPMLLPRPAEGYVAGDFGAGRRVLRGVSSGFADEDGLTALITADAPVETLDREALEGAIIAALDEPALDLRQGAYAVRRRAAIDWALVRRLAWLGVAIMTATLLITLVLILRYNLSAAAMEDKADALARQGLARGETVNDAGQQLTDRLSRLRGAGAGFSQTAAAVSSAVASVPGAEITGLNFDATGKLRVNLATQTQGQIVDVQNRLVAAGFNAEAGTFANAGGRMTGALTVTVR